MKGCKKIIILIAISLAATLCSGQSFVNIQKLLGGGFTIHTESQDENFSSVIPSIPDSLGTTVVRLINLDGSNMIQTSWWTGKISRLSDGRLNIRWPQQFEDALGMCRTYGWTPRIIWGRVGQDVITILKGVPNNHFYCCNDIGWTLYDEFTTEMLRHVSRDWGFSKIEVEVGNEPSGYDHASTNWWMRDISAPSNDSAMWRESLEPYLVLYRHISLSVNDYRSKHTDIKISVGGPASGFRTFLADSYPWLQTFVSRVLSSGLPLDFVSYHLYRKTPQQSVSLHKGIDTINAILARYKSAAKIVQSEWGTAGDVYGENHSPIAGAFALDILYELENTNVQSALYLSLIGATDESQSKASLYYRNSVGKYYASDAAVAMLELRKLSNGLRYSAISTSTQIRAFASQVRKEKELDVIAWAYNSIIAPAAFHADSIPGCDTISLQLFRTNRILVKSSIQRYEVKINNIAASPKLVFALRENVLSVKGLKLKKGDYVTIKIFFN